MIAAGEIIYEDGKFTKVDREGALRQFSELMARPLNPDEIERRRLSKAIFPHVKSFYEDYYSSDAHVPYHRQNSRI